MCVHIMMRKDICSGRKNTQILSDAISTKDRNMFAACAACLCHTGERMESWQVRKLLPELKENKTDVDDEDGASLSQCHVTLNKIGLTFVTICPVHHIICMVWSYNPNYVLNFRLKLWMCIDYHSVWQSGCNSTGKFK